MADEESSTPTPKREGTFYGFKVSDLQTGGIVLALLGIAGLATKVLAPDLFKPQEKKPVQQDQIQLTPQQLQAIRQKIIQEEQLKRQIAEANMAAETESMGNYNDTSIESIDERHEKYNTSAPMIDGLDMDMEYESMDDNVDPNIHKPIKTIEY